MTFTNPSNGPYLNAKGELVVGTGAGTQPGLLTVGSNNQVLTADSSQTTGMKWAASSSGGGLVLIQSQSASSSSALHFTSGLVYVDYLIVLSNIVTAGNPDTIYLQVSTNGGSSYLSTGYQGYSGTLLNSSPIYNLTSPNAFVLATNIQNTAGAAVSGQFQATFGTANSVVVGTTFLYSYGGGNNWAMYGGGGGGPANANAFQIVVGSGTIVSGTVTLYGYNE